LGNELAGDKRELEGNRTFLFTQNHGKIETFYKDRKSHERGHTLLDKLSYQAGMEIERGLPEEA
jgi:hypothetical protein